jgi:uncharacterized repeat protein (TIGR04138 family)
MKEISLRTIARNHTEFPEEAYAFVLAAITYSCEKFTPKPGVHITAKQLSEGVLEFVQESFGPMASFILEEWNIKTSENLGKAVFILLEEEAIKKRPEDKLEDFNGLFDFKKVLQEKPTAYELDRDVN